MQKIYKNAISTSISQCHTDNNKLNYFVEIGFFTPVSANINTYLSIILIMDTARQSDTLAQEGGGIKTHNTQTVKQRKTTDRGNQKL